MISVWYNFSSGIALHLVFKKKERKKGGVLDAKALLCAFQLETENLYSSYIIFKKPMICRHLASTLFLDAS